MSPAALLVALSAFIQLLVPARAGNIKNFGFPCKDTKCYGHEFGERKLPERILYTEHVKYKTHHMKVTSVDKTYPKRGETPKGTISYIQVSALSFQGDGGSVTIKEGGLGQDFVTLNFKSERNHGIDYFIRIFGN